MCAVLQRPECWEATHFLCLVHTSNRAPMGTNCHLAICNCEWEQCATDWGTKSTCFDDPFTSVISRYICLRNFWMEFGWFCIASCMRWKLLVPYWWVLLCYVGVSWQGIGNVWWDYLKFALKPLEPLRLDPCLMAPMCQGPSISHSFSQSWSPR